MDSMDDWSVEHSVFIDSTIVDSVMLVDTLSSTTYDTTMTSSFDSTLVDSMWVIDTVMTTTYDTTITTSYDSTYTSLLNLIQAIQLHTFYNCYGMEF